MKNLKNKRTGILIIILIGLLILAYKVMFVTDTGGDSIVDENVIAAQRVESVLKEIESINFDTSVVQDQNFQSLRSIETPFLSLPVGRSNPFSPVSGSN